MDDRRDPPSPTIGDVRVRVLGPVDALDENGRALPVGGPSQRLVLAVLAARRGDTVAAHRFVDALWGDEPPRTAQHSLRTYVSRLRRVLGDGVAIRPGGYALAVPPGEVDAGRFEDLVSRAAAAPPTAALELLDEALGLWRGPAFGDLGEVEALRGTAIRLEELRLAAREARAVALASAGRAAEAAAAAEELVAEQPLREGAWAALIDALAAADRVPEALRAYQRAVAVLAEAGLEPSERVRRAEHRALAGEGLSLPPRPLPAAASSLIGREVELEELDRVLATARVVTLVGPGGVGKTRLALEVARRAASGHEWGARLVELARVEEPVAVPGVVADALGLATEGGSPLAALSRAGSLDLLVVLDNCEHVIEAAAQVAQAVVTGGDRARVLATSRERLGVDGEQTWPVAPLAVGGERSPAHDLFVERARAARPRLALSDEDRVGVDRIVARLDGLPLAIEMAAARAATIPVLELADRLDEELDILRSHRRAVEARHRTLGAVVAWSEALLDDDDRALFAELSVFAGMAEVDDVAAVTGRASPLDDLCRLSGRSLLVADATGPRARFGMLGTIRTHAARRLDAAGRAPALARRHAEHVLTAAVAADQSLRTPAEAVAHARLDALTDELRAAHRWARAHDLELAASLSAALHVFAQSRLREEPLAWAVALVPELSVARPSPATPVVLASAAQRAVNAGDLAEARDLAERGCALAPAAADRAFPLLALADVHFYEGRLGASAAAAREALDAARRAADSTAEVAARANLALAEGYRGRYDRAEEALAREPGDAELAPSDEGWLAYAEGEVVLDRDPARALVALDRAAALAASVGNRYLEGVARVSACSLRARTGEPQEALAAFASVIEHWRRQRALKYQLTTLRNLVVLLQRLGVAPEAAELLGTVQADTVAPTFGDEAARLADAQAWVTSALGPHEAGRRLGAGAARTVDDAATAALGWLSRLAD